MFDGTIPYGTIPHGTAPFRPEPYGTVMVPVPYRRTVVIGTLVFGKVHPHTITWSGTSRANLATWRNTPLTTFSRIAGPLQQRLTTMGGSTNRTSAVRMGIAYPPYRLYRYGYRYRFYRLYRYNQYVILEISI
jgi:hypothetical protein